MKNQFNLSKKIKEIEKEIEDLDKQRCYEVSNFDLFSVPKDTQQAILDLINKSYFNKLDKLKIKLEVFLEFQNSIKQIQERLKKVLNNPSGIINCSSNLIHRKIDKIFKQI